MWNLLATAADKTRVVDIGEVALLALLGFVIVVAGIAFLILVVWAVGKIMSSGAKKESQPKEVKAVETVELQATASDQVDEETVAVITAALMAYYVQENRRCEFIVKRIKRI